MSNLLKNSLLQANPHLNRRVHAAVITVGMGVIQRLTARRHGLVGTFPRSRGSPSKRIVGGGSAWLRHRMFCKGSCAGFVQVEK